MTGTNTRCGAIALASVGLCVMLHGCITDGLYSEEFKESYNLTKDATLKVLNKNGEIRVTTWDEDQVEVFAVKRTNYRRSELDKVTIVVTPGEDLEVETKHDARQVRVSVQYEIRIPRGMPVTMLETSNGDISLLGSSGNTTIKTSNGDISVRDVEGYVSARTSNGRIEIRDTMGVLEATTSNGRILLEVPDLVSNLQIKTSNGAVKVYVSGDLDADLEMTTSNGNWEVHDLEVSVETSSSRHFVGRLGTGGLNLTIATSNGDIDIFKLG